MAITTEQTNFLVSLYVGYFDRAPDPAGMRFWIDQIENVRPLNTIAADFAASPVAKTLYPFLATGQGAANSFITSVYQNLFNATPDPAGLEFWEGVLESGKVAPADMIEAIIKGATGTGKQVLENKLAVGLDFAEKTGNKPGFEFDNAAENTAKEALSLVTKDVASVATGEAKTDAFLGGSSYGKTFTLTAGIDDVTGTSADDIIVVSYSGDGTSQTLSSLDTIDGGDGTDTLKVVNQVAGVTLDFQDGIGAKNVETLDVTARGRLDVGTKGNIETVIAKSTSRDSVKIDDYAAAADQKLKTVEIGAGSGPVSIGTNNATDIEQLRLHGTFYDVSVKANSGARDLTLAVNGATHGFIDDSEATGLKIVASIQASTLEAVYVLKAESIEIDAAADVTILSLRSDAAKTITIKGGSMVTAHSLGALGALKSIDASANTGGIEVALGADVQFTGGFGADKIVVADNSKDIAMGAGDDSLAISARRIADVSGKLDGGDGVDTIILHGADAVAATPAFVKLLSNFETLGLDGGAGTVDMANFGRITDVTLVSGQSDALTLNNVTSGATITYLENSGAQTAVNVKDSASGTADVLSVKISNNYGLIVGKITADNVETINFVTDDTNDIGKIAHSATIDGKGIKEITVSGDAGIRLFHTTGTGSEVIKFDSSAVTSGAVYWTAGALTGALTATGGASVETLIVEAATAGGTVDLGAGDDSVSVKDQMIVTGNDGNDNFWVNAPTNGTSYSTIQDFTADDKIWFAGVRPSNETDLGAAVSLAKTAVFQDYLDAAVATDSTSDLVKWFQYEGNTYVTIDRGAGSTFENGTDVVVKLAGLIDLSEADVAGGNLTL